MSRDIIVLTPNGRRQKVHCTPDTNILQILEDVCQKQGFQSMNYGLKHHNTILDLTTTIRFSNLPNKALLEMVETDRRREETNVTIGLLLEDGERRTADFPPNTSLFDLVTSLAPKEFSLLQNPTILYMRQEVMGESALKEKTLRQLGLIGGRAILRLLNKIEEPTQANISSVYRRPLPKKEETASNNPNKKIDAEQLQTFDTSVISGAPDVDKNINHYVFNPVELIKNERKAPTVDSNNETNNNKQETENIFSKKDNLDLTISEHEPMNTEPGTSVRIADSDTSFSNQEHLERRLRIEEEVTFLGTQKAIAFMPEGTEDEIQDLPDDFYDLTIEEVRKLYHNLQQNRIELENTPLVSSTKRQEVEKQVSHQRLNIYNNVVVRIQFPDHIILQGIFSPDDTIEDVINFVKAHLNNPTKPFHIFTTPLKESLDLKITLRDAKFVPCVHMHFKWLEEDAAQPYLKEEIYSKTTTSDAAGILASKYRAPSRRKIDEISNTSQQSNKGSTSKGSKIPKWFKK